MPPACLCKMQLCPASRRGEANALALAPPPPLPPLQRARLLPVHRSRSPGKRARVQREIQRKPGRGGRCTSAARIPENLFITACRFLTVIRIHEPESSFVTKPRSLSLSPLLLSPMDQAGLHVNSMAQASKL